MVVILEEEACRVGVVGNVGPVVCIVLPEVAIVAILQKINCENE